MSFGASIFLQFVIVIIAVMVVSLIFRFDKTKVLAKRVSRYSLARPKDKYKNKSYPFNITFYGFIKVISLFTSKSKLALRYTKKYYDKYLEYENKYLKPIDIMSMKLVFSLLNLLVVALIFMVGGRDLHHYDILISLIGGFFIVDIYYIYKHSLVKREVSANLVTCVIIIKNKLKKGQNFEEAVGAVIDEMTGPTKDEFLKILNDLQHDVSFLKAIKKFAKRMKTFETYIFVKYLSLADQETLIPVLEKIEKSMTFKNKIDIDLNITLNKYRTIGFVFVVLPILSIIAMYLITKGLYFTNILDYTYGIYYLISLILIYLVYLILVSLVFRTRPYYEDK